MEKYKQALRDFLAGVMPGRENALVFGEGPEKPKLMLIGEAPGEQETMMGRPFVGKAGKNLDHFLELAGMRREEIYISNAVKIRPTKTGKTGRISNRPPTKEEIALFRPWLLRLTIGEAHGRAMEAGETGRRLFALYHPASLIYNRALEPVYEQDVRALAAWIARDACGAAISDAKTDI